MATLTGTSGNDSLSGTTSADTLYGLAGNDTLLGLADNDTLYGNDGVDRLEGGAGNDALSGGSGTDQFVFHEMGAANADVVQDFAGNNWDSIRLDVSAFGALGSTTGRFAAGDARFYAGAGATGGHDADDRIVYNTSTGQLFYDADGSGAGTAQLIATFQGAPTITAADIDVFGTPPPPPSNVIDGTEGNDTIVGTTGNDIINGLGGNDSLVGWDGADSLSGGAGDDTLNGYNGSVPVSGNPENVRTADTLDGGLGNDTYQTGGEDILTDAGGVDTVIAYDTSWTLGSGFENLLLQEKDADWGMSGTGNELDNVIDASARERAITLDGRAGNDLVIGAFRYNDLLLGGEGNDTLLGVSSVGDFLILDGGAGNDRLEGDGYFLFSAAPGAANADVIVAFTSGVDTVQLDGTVHLNSGPSGRLASGDARFYSAAGATSGHDADDRVIYDTSTGNLWYDADGSGTGSGQLIAALGAGTSLASTDIEILNGSVTPPGGGTPPPPPAGSIVGTEGNDSLSGTAGNDTIYGLGGNDFIGGNGGADSIVGGSGNDSIFGNDGNDWIEGTTGNDSLSGGSGQDSYVFRESGAANADIVGSFSSSWDNLQLDAAGFSAIGASGRFASGDVRFFAGAGATGGHDANDRIVYNTSTGQLFYDADGSGAGPSQLIATFQGAPTMAATDITMFGTATPPPPPGSITGTNGNDSLVGTSGNDTIYGLDGNDTIDGLAGADSMVGGNGDDLYFVDNPGDVVVETQNGGIDEVRSTIDYTLPDWVNNLTLLGTAQVGHGNTIDNVIVGTGESNSLFGHAGNDTLIGGGSGSETPDFFMGGAGNDSMVGSSSGDAFDLLFDTTTSYGNDTIVGGGGIDTILANNGPATSGIVADLAAGTLSGGEAAGSAVISGIEAVYGTSFADRMTGDGAANEFRGNGGNDTLNGGAGNDALWGDAGADSFIFSSAPGAANADLLPEFTSGVDELVLDASAMPGLGSAGDMAAGDVRFYAAAGATGGHDADDRVVYDTSTGQLFYDADGSGAGTAQLIATLDSALALSATDIAVVNGTTPPPTPGTTLNGTTGNDTLVGTAGNDTIWGNSGNDWIEGRGGNDQLSGGSGQDSYVFREFGAANADTLLNFSSSWDAMRFDNAAFTALGADGRFAAGDARFYAAAGATGGHDADDRIVYNTSIGALYYDADGAGGADALLVATVQGAAPVAAQDIWVI